jgi:hypothetical protein
MPFTFAHPAAVLPLRRVSQKYLSFTALIIGSMAPDAEYFIRMQVDSRYFHTTQGLLYFDLPVGLLLYMMHKYILRPATMVHLPDSLARRFTGLQQERPRSAADWLVICMSLLAGAVSHLLWDSFTHSRGYFVRHYAPLQKEIPIPGDTMQIFLILQQGSTVLGLLALAWTIYRLPLGDSYFSPPVKNDYFWVSLFGAALIVLLLKWLFSGALNVDDWIVSSISALFIGLFVASCLYLYKKANA